MSNIFAKLYERDGVQVLVTAETSEEDKPVIRVMTTLKEIGVVSFNLGYKDSDEGYYFRDKRFNEEVTEDWAFETSNKLFRGLELTKGKKNE